MALRAWASPVACSGMSQRCCKSASTPACHWSYGIVAPTAIQARRDSGISCCSASHFEFANPAKPPKKAEGIYLCKQRFIAIANNAQRNYVVLVIDEAQDLTFREWKWLVGLQNDLDYEGYLLSVFSVGSHQLNYRHEYMAITGNAHLAARFMAAHARFHGLRSPEEIGYVLNGYDNDSEWPPGSGVPYLKYFAPGDFAAGRRLADCAERLWKALVELSLPDAACRQSDRGDTFPVGAGRRLGRRDVLRELVARTRQSELPRPHEDHLDGQLTWRRTLL